MSNEVVVNQEINTPAQQSAMPAKMLELAIQQDADIDKLEKLMDLQERYDAKQAKSDYLVALSRFQSECPAIVSMKKGHNYKYAPLSDIVAQIKDLLSSCGLSYRFEQAQDSGNITVRCVTSHVSGHSESLEMTAQPDTSGSKNTVQSVGSTVTYLRRYTLTGALGIVTADEDSDGRVEASSGISANDKTWVRAIKSGVQKIDDIEDPSYRAHIASLLDKVK